jgi:hypothetical protein
MLQVSNTAAEEK